jgi:hypothetical protein
MSPDDDNIDERGVLSGDVAFMGNKILFGTLSCADLNRVPWYDAAPLSAGRVPR